MGSLPRSFTRRALTELALDFCRHAHRIPSPCAGSAACLLLFFFSGLDSRTFHVEEALMILCDVSACWLEVGFKISADLEPAHSFALAATHQLLRTRSKES